MKNISKIGIALLALAIFLCAPLGSAFALSLDGAKSHGLVGETPSGYLAAIPADPASEVTELVQSINMKRKEQYSQIASKNGTSLKNVELLAGQKAIAKTSPGNYYRDNQGNWIRK